MTFQPLQVTATLAGPVALPNGPIAFEALVGYAVTVWDGVASATTASECVPLDIPIARDPTGRLYLASVGFYEVEAREQRWINRKFPVAEAQALAEESFLRIRISAGAQKSYRLPLEAVHLRDGRMKWWCVGDEGRICDLLTRYVGNLGKRRGVGLGKIARWDVVRCEAFAATWAPFGSFPIVSPEALPTRSLPLPWPGLADDAERAYRTIEPPYWDRSREVLCAVPRMQ